MSLKQKKLNKNYINQQGEAYMKSRTKSGRDEPKGMGRMEAAKNPTPSAKKDNKDCKPAKKGK